MSVIRGPYHEELPGVINQTNSSVKIPDPCFASTVYHLLVDKRPGLHASFTLAVVRQLRLREKVILKNVFFC